MILDRVCATAVEASSELERSNGPGKSVKVTSQRRSAPVDSANGVLGSERCAEHAAQRAQKAHGAYKNWMKPVTMYRLRPVYVSD